MSKLDKLAERFGLEEYVNYKIELGKIYIIQKNQFGQRFWLFFANKIAYRGNYVEMFNDIANALEEE